MATRNQGAEKKGHMSLFRDTAVISGSPGAYHEEGNGFSMMSLRPALRR